MPKEAAHLYLAGFAIKEMTRTGEFPRISKILESAPNLFSMGSVAPDSIYNYVKGPAREFFYRSREYSHGKSGESEDSHGLFDFFNRFAKGDLPVVPALSFGLGTLCHLAADMVFHPVVFYFTGRDRDEKKDGIIRHFYFESELDRTLRWIFPELRRTHLAPCFRNREMDRDDLATALEAIHIPASRAGWVPAGEFVSMYRQHTVHEKYYGSIFFFLLARLLNSLSGRGKPDLPALFYRDRPGRAPVQDKEEFLNRMVAFKNPESGAVLKKSFSMLRLDFMELFGEYLRPLEEVLKKQGTPSWDSLLPVFQSWIPRSPETGQPMPGARGEKAQMSYFDLKSFEQAWGLK